MGECLIVRRGGESYELPVLSASYPKDVTVTAAPGASASFSVSITTPGRPAEYTYQWYKNGAAISGATGASLTLTGLTAAATYSVYCKVTNKAGSVTTRTATLTVRSYLPTYTYTGSHQLLDDGNFNWRLKLLTSGTLTFTHLGSAESQGAQVFLVGGGGGGSWSGGGGGYTRTASATLQTGSGMPVTIGAGGGGNAAGGTTSAFGATAAGGSQGGYRGPGGNGGSGGGGGGSSSSLGDGPAGGSGGSDGGNGGNSSWAGGNGQGSTTREFGESGATLYAGGGGGAGAMVQGAGGAGGGSAGSSGLYGTPNTGGGGGGAYATSNGYAGGSGIVILRNRR